MPPGQRLSNIALRDGGKTGEVSYWSPHLPEAVGVATRALRLLSDWAFTALKLSEIELWTHVDNAASRTVAERARFRRAPDGDQQRTVKGQVWRTVGYIRPAPGCAT